jgi:hypothetical protein
MSQFMQPVPYFRLAVNDREALLAEKADLIKIAEAAATPWIERTRARSRLDEVTRLLRMDEMARRETQRSVEPPAQQPAGRGAHQSAQRKGEPVHKIVCAPGYKAITENADGTGAILIIEDKPKGS